MTKRNRAARLARVFSPDALTAFPYNRGAWYETEEEIQAGLAWGRRKAELMRWVRKQMNERLTARERRCIELYFFDNLTYREAGAATETNASSVYRAVQRSLRKLRRAAEEGQQTARLRRRRR
jgi:RNA polymerase sigma factor (sigma-70 family)